MATTEEVRAEVARELGVDVERCTDDATLEALGADSLDVIEIVIAVEELCRVSISDAEVDRCRTVGDLVKFAGRGAR